MLSERTNKPVSSLQIDGNLIDDPQCIAEHFNEFFTGIAAKLDATIETTVYEPVDYIRTNIVNSFFVSPVSPQEIMNVVRNLKNSTYGLFSVPTKLFKLIICYVALPLSDILNNSFSRGIFPDCLKDATVVPVYKSGSETDVNNYRPISVLPLVSKIFEKCMYVRLLNFLTKYNVLSKYQFGFQRSKNTSDALLNFVEHIYNNLNDKKHVLGLSIDFKKAFDTVDHKILLSKLAKYGVHGTPYSWFASYLYGRSQRVRIGKVMSAARLVSYGVPQGSVLGPLLFLIYINDLDSISNDAHFTLFADDTTLACGDIAYGNLVRRSNVNLSNLYKWTTANRLSLNVSKTSVILFTNRLNSVEVPLIVNVNGNHLNFDSCLKFLGVKLDHNLNFSEHIKYICAKISKSAGVLYRISKFVPSRILINLYYSLIYPYLIYGILIWGDAAKVHLNSLILLQKRIIRTITSSDYLAHTRPLFINTKILPIEHLYTYNLGIFMFKQHISKTITYPNHQYNTRAINNAVPKFQRLSQCQRSIHFNGPKCWNDIPSDIQSSKSLAVFKSKFREFLLNKLSAYTHVN